MLRKGQLSNRSQGSRASCSPPPSLSRRRRLCSPAMPLLSALANSELLDLLMLDVPSLVSLSECSRDALQLVSSSPLWSAALRELKHQQIRAGIASEEPRGVEPRVRVGLGMRQAHRDTERLHRFFTWHCDQAPAFDMEAHPEQDDVFGLREQGHLILDLRMRNRPRYNLISDTILLHMAEDDLRGATHIGSRGRVHERDPDDACHSFQELLDASDEQVREVAASNRSEIALHPCGGSFFSGWWCGYVFDMFGAGEDAWARGPIEGLVGVRLGSDAHLDFLLSARPAFLTPGLWGGRGLAHLDLLHPVRRQLDALKQRFPYSPSVAPRFLPFRFSTYAEFDTFLENNPEWLADHPWATGAMSSDEEDGESEDGDDNDDAEQIEPFWQYS